MEIKNITEIGGYKYLHYWFQDSGLDIIDLEAAKQITLAEQLSNFLNVRKVATTSNGQLDEAYNLAKEIEKSTEEGGLETAIAELFGSPDLMPSAASFSGVSLNGENLSFATIGQRGRKNDLANLTAQIADSIADSQEAAQKAINTIIDVISVEYPTIKTAAFQEQLNGIVANRTAQELIQDSLTSGYKFLSIPTDNKAAKIMQSIARLHALAEAIPQITNSKVRIRQLKATYSSNSAVNIRSRSQLLAVLLGKIGGNLSSLGGACEEIVAAYGMQRCLKEGAELITQIKLTGADVKMTQDKDLKRLASEPIPSIVQNKSDVEIIANINNVKVTYGLNVKRANVRTNADGVRVIDNVKLQQDTPLQQILWKAIEENPALNTKYIYNLAGGLETNQRLNLATAWTDLVDYSVLVSFLSFLAGEGTLHNNAMAMVINRQLVPIEKILQAVANNPEAISYTGGKQRFPFWHINQANWVGDEGIRNREYAEIRSTRVTNEILRKFQSTKVTTYLNLNLLHLINP